MAKLTNNLFGRRFWAIVVAVLMIVQLLPVTAIADNVVQADVDGVIVDNVRNQGYDGGIDVDTVAVKDKENLSPIGQAGTQPTEEDSVTPIEPDEPVSDDGSEQEQGTISEAPDKEDESDGQIGEHITDLFERPEEEDANVESDPEQGETDPEQGEENPVDENPSDDPETPNDDETDPEQGDGSNDGEPLREEVTYYLVVYVGDTLTGQYALTRNTGATDVEEYLIARDLNANDKIKVIGVSGETTTWYPDGVGNDWVITEDGNYTVYFQPNGRTGGNGYFDVVKNESSTIIVTFNPNTEEGGELANIEIEVAVGETIGDQLPAVPTVPGYNTKWVVSGTETEVTADTIVTVPFTAVVSKEKIVYTVTFVQEDGTEETKTTSIDDGFAVNELPEVTPKTNKIGKWVYPGTTNEFTVGTVISEDLTVKAYYEQNIFTVKFMVDGAQYEEMTTATGTTIVLPSDPVKSGATFKGWFTEPDGKGTQYTAESTVNEDLTLYAYFEGQVTVRFLVKDDNGNVIQEKSQYFVDLTAGDQITTLPDDPFIEGKVFDHWENEKTHETVEVGYTVTESFNAVAVFKTVDTYVLTVNYFYKNEQGTRVEIGSQIYELVEGDFPYTVTAPGFTIATEVTDEPTYYPSEPTITVTKDQFTQGSNGKYTLEVEDEYVAADAAYKVGHYLKNLDGDGYTLIGTVEKVGVKNSKVTPDINSYAYADFESRDENVTITETSNPKQELKVYYTRRDFTLSYNVGGGEYIDAVTAPYGTQITLPATATRAGYTFAGWYKDSDCTQAASSPFVLEENTTLYAKWNAAQVNYKIVYMIENANDDGYSFLKDVTRQAATDTELTLTATQANQYAPNDLDQSNFTFFESSTETIKADDSSVVVVRYKRNVYTLSWNGDVYDTDDDRVQQNAGSGSITAKYGASITQQWISTFNTPYPNWAWSLTQHNNDKVISIDTMPGKGEKFGESNTTLNFTNNRQTVYAYEFSTTKTQTLHYWLQNYEGTQTTTRNGKTYGLYKVVTGKFNYLYDNSDFYQIDGYTKDGYTATYIDWWGRTHNYTLGNGTPNYDLDVNFYYAAKQHTLAFYNYDGTLISSQQVTLNSDISSYLTSNVPAAPMEGAEWLGWFTDAEHTEPYSGGTKMPAGLVLYGNFSFPTRTVTFDSQGGTSVASQTDEYGFYATTPTDPTRENYTFQGWFTAADETGSPYDWNQPVTADITLYAHWTQKTIGYTVHYYEKGTTTSVLPDKTVSDPAFTEGTEVTENAPTVAGHVADKATATLELSFNEEENVIIFYYDAIPNELTYTVNYVLQDHPEIMVAESKTVTVPGSTTNVLEFAVEVDTAYLATQTTEADILGKKYRPVESQKELQLALENNVITFEYISNTTTKITVNYLDMDGNSIHDTDVSYVEKGDTFTVQNKAPEGFVYHHAYLAGTTTAPQATYQITGDEGNLVINIYYQKKLIIIANNKSKTYDGTALSSSFATVADYTVTGIARGDTLSSLEFDGSQTNAGTSATTPKNAVITLGTTGTAAPDQYYSIIYVPGSLTVKPVSVCISISADQWNTHSGGEGPNYYTGQTFNVGFTNPGKQHFNEDTSKSAYISITSGQRALFKEKYGDAIWSALAGTNGVLISEKDAGTYTVTGAEQRATVAGVTVGGQAMMSDPNYSITLYARDSFLKIEPLPLTITTPSAEKAYDGTALTKEEGATLDHSYWTANNGGEWTAAATATPGSVTLGTGETITFSVTGSQTPVGSSDNTYSIDWGENKSSNYKINANLGTLNVTSGSLTVTVKDIEKVYNGSEQEGRPFVATVNGTGATITTDDYTVEGLGKGDVLTIVYTPAKGTNVGEYTNGSFAETFTIVNANDQNVTDNYATTTFTPGKLTITKATMTVTAVDYEGVYDGQTHNGGATPSVTEGTTIQYSTDGGETWTATAPSITHVGTVNYKVKATNPNYEDATDDGTLEVTPATLTIVTESGEKEYDGKALTADGSISGFVNNETATFEVTGSQTEVGKSDNTYTLTWDGTAVKTDYTLDETIGELEVKTSTKELKVVSKDGSWTYDGNAHTKYEYTVTYGDETYNVTIAEGATTGTATLSTGDVVTITPATTATITHVAESDVDNAFTWTVANEGFYTKGTDTVGKLSITPATLTIVTESGEKEYDGKALTADGSISGFVNNETATFEVTGSQTEVGKSDNTYTLTWDGTAVKTDYTLDETIGELEVKTSTKELKVVSKDGSWTYDGNAHTKYEYTVTYGDETYNVTIAEGATTGTATLSTGDVVTITPATTATITHVAESDVDNAFTWTVANEGFYTKGTDTVGKLSITPATLTIVTESGEKEYDGKALTADGSISGFVNNETATFEVTGSQTEVGKSDNTYTLTWDGTAVKTDYTLDETIGELEVKTSTKELKVVSKDGSWTYDGNAHTKYEYTVTYGDETYNVTIAEGATTGTATLSTGDVVTITPATTATITHVAESDVDNAFTWTVANEGFYTKGTDTVGKLSITPATLTIVTESGEKEYDGKALTADGSISGFVNNETATFEVTGSQTEVGKSDNTYTLTWDGTAVKTDYTLDETIGELEVKTSTKELKVVSKDGSWTYDGNAHTKYEYTVTYGDETYNVTIAEGATTGTATLSTGDVVTITPATTATITHVAESDVDNAFTWTVANEGFYTKGTDTVGKLSITPATLTIVTESGEKEYDGKALTADGSISGFVNNETATFEVTGSQTEVGKSDNTYTLTWDGTAVKTDYTLDETIGELEVKTSTKELKVVSKDGSWTYDGNAHTKYEYTVTYGDETYNVTIAEGATTGTATLSTGDVVTITPATTATITHVAESDVDNAFTWTVANEGFYTKGTDTVGKLSITPATLTIVTESGEKEYDGKALTADGSISGFVNNETATFEVTGSQTEVGKSDNTYTLTWDGTAVKTDYTLDETIGELEVKTSTKELKVVSKDGSWTYDGNAHTKYEYTVTYGDETYNVTIAEGATTGTATLSTGDVVTITPATTATITHVAESDVDNAFTWTVANEGFYTKGTDTVGKLSITPATLTIVTESGEKEYDGKALTADGSISGFVNNETATFEVTGSQTEVGKSDNTYTLTWDGTAVKTDYTLDETIGELEVKTSTKELKVVSKDGSWTYDGNAHTKYEYTVTYGDETYNVTIAEGATTGTATLSTGDVVTITPATTATITHVAESDVDNAFTWTVANEGFYTKGTDTVGKLSITPATLTIVTESGEKEYDGKALTADGSISGFVNNETATFEVTGSQTEVGKSDNTYTLTWDGTAVKTDYTLDETIGELEVKTSTKELKVVSKDGSWTYDGNAHTKYEYTVTYGDETYNVTIAEGATTGTATLSTGDVVTITPATTATITHVAESDVDNAFTWTVANEGFYTKGTDTVGKLSITPATLTIVTESGEKEYDGKALTADGSISGFVNNETATFEVTGSQTEVGKSDNTYTLTWDGTAVKTDYTLDETIGELEVKTSTKELKVVSKDGSWTYDGNAHTKYEYTVTYGDETYNVTIAEGATTGTATLSTGDVVTITPATTATITHVAESDVDNAFTWTVANEGFYTKGTDTVGKLSITPATLTIVTESGEKEYDGKALTADGSISGFVNNETATFEVTGSQTEVGKSDNTYTLTWDGTAVKTDYTLDETIGELEVKTSTKELKVVSKDGSWTYDGNAHTKYEYTVTYGDETYNVTIAEGATTGTATLSTGDVVTITPATTATITHVAESDVDNAFTWTVANEGFYTKGTDTVGKLSITPATLTIVTESGEKEYDGKALTADGSISGFVNNETATFEVTGSQTEVGKSDNTYTLTWDGTAVKTDYTLDETIGELEVKTSTKELKVVSKDGSWTYDGNAHTKYEYTVTYGDETYNVTIAEGATTGTATLSTGDVVTITPATTATITHVAESDVDNAFTWTVANEGFYTKGTDTVGKLSITPATLTIVTESGEKEYDGKALTADGSISGFVNNETATFEVTGSQTEVGKSDNTYTLTWDGTAVKTDYTLDETIGELEVKTSTKELKVVSKDGSWTYDGNAHTKYEYTVTYGDETYNVTIAEGATTGTATLSTGDVVTITPATTATITHVAESDVDNAFTWTVANEGFYTKGTDTVGKLSITPATLTIVTESGEKEYDGKALTADGSISGFVNNETATFEVTGSQTEVGKSDNTYTLTWDGTAVKTDYTLDETIGELEVKTSTKELKVVSKDGSWTYDGNAHTKYEYTVTYGDETYNVTIAEGATTGTATLSTGDVVTITPATTATITHVAESDVDNAFTWTVANEGFYTKGTDTVGKLSITPATLTIVTESGEKEYDGKALTADGSISGFVNNETATFEVTGSQTEVGKSDNTYTLTWDGTAVKTDYTLDETIGELEVKTSTKELKVVSKDGSWTYDGNAHTKYEYTVTYGDETYNVTIAEGATTGTATLSTGDVVTITPATTATITHVAESDVDNAFTWTVANEGFYTKGTDTVGKLSITPATLTIVTESGEKEYDGKALTADGSISGFVNNETATFEVTGSQTEVGKSDNTYTLTWDGTAVKTDYTLDETIGELEVKTSTKELKVVSKDGSWTYDGNAHTKYEYTVTYGDETYNVTIAEGATTGTATLSTGDVVTITPATTATITHVAESDVDNAFTWTVANEGFYTKGTDTVGKLSITPATLTIVTESGEKEYDGKALTADGSISGFVNNETATFEVTGSQTEVGKSDNTYTLTWDGTAVKTDYTLDETIGELEVKTSTKELKVVSKDGSWTYDGNAHTKYEYTVTYGDETYNVTIAEGATTGTATLSTGDVVTITPATTATITHVAESDVDNAFTWTVANEGFYTKGTDTVGKLSITPATLTIVTESGEKEYDGKALTADGSISGFVNNETATFEVTGSQTEVGKSDNTYTLTWDGTAVKTDYTLDETIGELEVKTSTKELKVVSKDGSWTYDGNAHTKYEYTVTYGDETYNVTIAEGATTGTATLSTGDVVTITPATTATITHVAESDVDNAFTWTVANEGFYTKGTDTVGKLSITPATLTIVTESGEKEYDGKALTADGSISGFVNNETATFEVTGSQTEVGKSDNTYTLTWDGTAVKTDYTLDETIGELEVKTSTKELKVVSKDGSWTYDGNAHTKYEYTVTYGDETYNVTIAEGATTGTATLSTGDVVTITPATTATITHVAESDVDNAFTWTVANEGFYTKGTDTVGKLSITPATLTIVTESGEKEYDGKALTADGSISGFVNNETATFEVTGSQTEVGKSDNTYTLTWDGTAVKTDYTLDETIGELEVKTSTKELKVVSKDGSWTYDGNAHTKYEYTVTYGDETYNVTIAEGATTGTATLSTGDVVTITPATTATITHVAESDVDNAFTWTVANEGFYTKGTDTVGKLSITPATLTIVTESGEKEYDGKALTADGSISGFVNNETATFEVTGSQTEVGKSDNTYTLTWDGTAVKTDYTLDETIGELEVTENTAEVTLTAASDEKVYDGTALTNATVTVSGLPEGFTVEATAAGSQTDVGSSANVVNDGYKFFDKDGNDKTANFTNVKKVDGTLTVTPATLVITITGKKDTKVYNGSEQSVSGYTAASESELFDESKIVFNGSAEAKGTNVGNYPMGLTANQFSYDDPNFGTVTFNVTDGGLEITPITDPYEITVTGNSDTKVYNGSEQSVSGYTVSEYDATITFTGIAQDDEKATAKGTNVGTYTMAMREADFTATSENYTNIVITVVPGTLEITPITDPYEITVTGNSDTKVYNGSEQSVSGYTVSEYDATITFTGIAQDDEKATAKGTNVGTYTMTMTEADFTATSENYTNIVITVVPGTLEITPVTDEVVVKITGHNNTATYDATEHAVEGYDVEISNTLYKEADFTFSGTAEAKRTDVGQTDMGLAADQFKNISKNFTNVKFEVTDGYQKIEPLKVTVTITGNKDSKVYNGEEQKVEGYEVEISDALYTEADFSFSGEAVAKGTEVGKYPMGLAEDQFTNNNENFEVTFVVNDGELEITPAPLTIKIDDKTKVYGDADPEFTYTVSGMAEGEELPEGFLKLTRDPGEDVGEYKIHGELSKVMNRALRAAKFSASNYEITIEEGTLTITPRTITVTANDANKTQGQADPEFTVTIEGLVDGDSESEIAYTIDREPGEAPGTYAINVSGDEEQGNYIVVYVPGTLTIDRQIIDENPPLAVFGTFSFYFISDTMMAKDDEARNGAYKAMIDWAAENREALGSLAVVGSGNMVAQYDDADAWEFAKDTLNTLPAELPYFNAAGRTDVNGDEMNYEAYISNNLNKASEKYEDGKVWYQLFEEQNVMLVGIGYMKPAETDEEQEAQDAWIAYVNEALAAHEDFFVILTMNDYIDANGELTAFGALVEERIVAENENVELILSGNANGAAHRTQTYGERTVDAIMYNYQADEAKGLGFMRIITIDGDTNTITIATYSPVMDTDTYDESKPENDFIVIENAF